MTPATLNPERFNQLKKQFLALSKTRIGEFQVSLQHNEITTVQLPNSDITFNLTKLNQHENYYKIWQQQENNYIWFQDHGGYLCRIRHGSSIATRTFDFNTFERRNISYQLPHLKNINFNDLYDTTKEEICEARDETITGNYISSYIHTSYHRRSCWNYKPTEFLMWIASQTVINVESQLTVEISKTNQNKFFVWLKCLKFMNGKLLAIFDNSPL